MTTEKTNRDLYFQGKRNAFIILINYVDKKLEFLTNESHPAKDEYSELVKSGLIKGFKDMRLHIENLLGKHDFMSKTSNP